MILIKSKFIKAVEYDELTEVLKVLIGTKIYYHYAVPDSVFKNFMISESKGNFYNKKIRGKYD